MAHYSGYVVVPTDSFESFKSAVNGNSYDVDGVAGCQCVDLSKLINWNLGFPSPYYDTGGTGYAWGGWTVPSARNFNAGSEYTLVTSVQDIKKGDMIVMDATSSNPAGHVTFANEDYNGTSSLSCLGQNQGGDPAPGGGTTVNIANLGLGQFLGAFRLKKWQPGPGPTPATTQKRFPWVLYARRLRQKRTPQA